jgi:hypothetical protein
MTHSPMARPGLACVRLALAPAVFSAVLLTVLCVLFNPRWETNDDVAMSMVAHGYGIAAVSSPNIVFSNVIWGYLVRMTPSIGGVLGYSIATLMTLFVSSFSILYFMNKLGVARCMSMIVACIVLGRAVLFPQFTINAGLLAASSVLALLSFSKTKSALSLIAAAVLGAVAFLIRSQEFIFVLVVALPTLWSRRLHRNGLALCIGAIMLVSLFGAVVWDHVCYSSPAWKHFAMLDASRAPFTDFGIAQKIADAPNLLKRFGYSRNDIELLERFFFVDPSIFKPDTLRAMISSLGAMHVFESNRHAVIVSLESLLSPEMAPLVALGAFLLVCAPSVELVIGWALFLFALVAMGLVGRGGLLRVDMPIVSLFCMLSTVRLAERRRVAAANRASRSDRMQRATVACAVIATLLASGYVLVPQARQASHHTQEVQAAASRFPSETVVAWGAGPEYESLFPLLASDAHLRAMKIFALGVFTYAPFSVSAVQEAQGRGFVDRIRSPNGLLIMTTPYAHFLDVWCRERFHGRLESKVVQAAPYVPIDRYRCVDS